MVISVARSGGFTIDTIEIEFIIFLAYEIVCLRGIEFMSNVGKNWQDFCAQNIYENIEIIYGVYVCFSLNNRNSIFNSSEIVWIYLKR